MLNKKLKMVMYAKVRYKITIVNEIKVSWKKKNKLVS